MNYKISQKSRSQDKNESDSDIANMILIVISKNPHFISRAVQIGLKGIHDYNDCGEAGVSKPRSGNHTSLKDVYKDVC